MLHYDRIDVSEGIDVNKTSEKVKKRQYYCERNKHLSEEQKQKLVEYRRN